MVTTSNREASYYVNKCESFKGSHIFGKWLNHVYKVYSYGYHFPLYAFKDGRWYKNTDKYSVTTSKHSSQLCPYSLFPFIELDTEGIKSL